MQKRGSPTCVKCTAICAQSLSQSSSHSMAGAKGPENSTTCPRGYLVIVHCDEYGGFVFLSLSCLENC
jgi:hypothetical protein